MAFLKFNKSELVNLGYSLKREILSANRTGAYCNTSIVTCNTRRYHGLLAVTLDRFGGDRYMLLSSVDESLLVDGKQFNLGIHCYGDIYEPRGHKYVIDYSADPVPQITSKVGEIIWRKTIVLAPDKDQVFIKYELLDAPGSVKVQLRPFLAFRNIHALTHENPAARFEGTKVPGGLAFRLYEPFPDLNLQLSAKSNFVAHPHWNNNITYSDEYRRGFDCREDLAVPGYFELTLNPGENVILSASIKKETASRIEEDYNRCVESAHAIKSNHDQLVHCAEQLITNHNGRRKINAGLSWMYTGLLRETLIALPGLALYGLNDKKIFEEVLDNLIEDNQERLYKRTTQVEAPLYMACTLQAYIDYGADPKKVWKKYGAVIRGILESYLPGVRNEIAMHPNGLLWAQVDGVALTWMNAYINGRAVTERAGYQVETNAFWYNAICFALEMEGKYGGADSGFIGKWTAIRDLVKGSYQPTFLIARTGALADYVGYYGQNDDIRPNQIYAIWVKYSPVDEELAPSILRVIDRDLVTARGIRTLSPRDAKYKGVYEGTQIDRDLAYHQGSTRPFLLEPYVAVSLRVKGQSFVKRAQWLVEGFADDLGKHGVGAYSELYDGDPPHECHGAISSALSTAALLAVDYMLDKFQEEQL